MVYFKGRIGIKQLISNKPVRFGIKPRIPLLATAVKATSHSTIFDIPMRPLREDQIHRRRFTRERSPATPVMVIIPLNFARCTLPTHRDR